MFTRYLIRLKFRFLYIWAQILKHRQKLENRQTAILNSRVLVLNQLISDDPLTNWNISTVIYMLTTQFCSKRYIY